MISKLLRNINRSWNKLYRKINYYQQNKDNLDRVGCHLFSLIKTWWSNKNTNLDREKRVIMMIL